MSIVVSDTSPLRALEHIGYLDLVTTYFHEILIPPAVADDLENPAPRFVPIPVTQIKNARVLRPSDQGLVQRLLGDLERGEAEAIALALEVRAQTLLIDEAKGRTIARRMGVNTIGAVGMLAQAKRDGRIAQIKPLLDELRTDLGFHISNRFYESFLRSVGE